MDQKQAECVEAKLVESLYPGVPKCLGNTFSYSCKGDALAVCFEGNLKALEIDAPKILEKFLKC